MFYYKEFVVTKETVNRMISFNLRCKKDHVFEAWFPDSQAYEKQRKSRKIACPSCGDKKIEKALMAPNIASGASRKSSSNEPSPKEVREALVALRKAVENNSEYVGSDFPEEARKIHYGETKRRDIYGEASDEDAKELEEEGVEIAKIPWVETAEN